MMAKQCANCHYQEGNSKWGECTNEHTKRSLTVGGKDEQSKMMVYGGFCCKHYKKGGE